MKRKAIIVILLLSYMMITSYAQQSVTEITYIGKTGLLIKIGDKKILIDMPCKDADGDCKFPREVQNKLMLAQAPYDHIDLILVAHAYVEYISTDMVSQHMQNNPKVIFASTEQMVSAINVFSDRCVVFNPTEEKSDSQVINDFTIESFYFPPEPNSPMNNIGFVVSFEGQTLFQTSHFGDEIYKGDN